MKKLETGIQIFGCDELKVNKKTQDEIFKRWHEYERLIKLENCVRSLYGAIPCHMNEDWKEYTKQFVNNI